MASDTSDSLPGYLARAWCHDGGQAAASGLFGAPGWRPRKCLTCGYGRRQPSSDRHRPLGEHGKPTVMEQQAAEVSFAPARPLMSSQPRGFPSHRASGMPSGEFITSMTARRSSTCRSDRKHPFLQSNSMGTSCSQPTAAASLHNGHVVQVMCSLISASYWVGSSRSTGSVHGPG